MASSGVAQLNEADLAVLDEIRAGFERNGYAPTVRELALRLGYRWPQSVQRRVERLVQAGELQRQSGQLRTLVPTRRGGTQKAVRWLKVVGLPPVTARASASQRIPLPIGDLLAEGEEGIAFVAESRIAGGPNIGDLVYCAAGGRAMAVTLSSSGRQTIAC